MLNLSLSPIHTGSFGSLGVVQKTKKKEDWDFESFVFWVLLHDLNDWNDLVWTRL